MDASDISLGDLESKWKSYVRDLDSSQVIGLFPFSEEEKNIFLKLTSSINTLDDSTLSEIFSQLFKKYPFSTSIWVASTAAESYANGEFWTTFPLELGLPNHFKDNKTRKLFLENFRKACITCGFTRYYPKKELRKSFIAEFLFYAGFPICYSQNLADAILQLHRRNELPSLDEDDAPEILLDLLSEHFSNSPIITLKRALQSDAGILIAETALNVLYTGDFHKVNKKLGEALRSSFANISLKENISHNLRPALYLNSELTGFEIHCYKQYDLIEGSDFGWIINGDLFRRNNNEEFIYEIQDAENEVKVQPQGVRNPLRSARNFDISRLRHTTQEISFFDANTLKLKVKYVDINSRDIIEVPAGEYWLLSPKNVSCENALDELDIASAKLQRIDVIPGKVIELKRDVNEHFEIRARLAPVILLSNTTNVLRAYSGDPIVIKDSCTLDIWDTFYTSQSHLKVESNDIYKEFPIVYANDNNEWQFTEINISDFLKLLPNCLCELQISLIRSRRVKAKKKIFYLNSVSRYDAGNIHFNVVPSNIKNERLSGYSLTNNLLKVEDNDEPFRSITFELNGDFRSFTFRNEGVFAQIVQRKIGAKDITAKFILGNEFYVSSSDLSSMRIWNSKGKDIQIFIDRFAETTIPSYSYFDISLSNLADRFPSGGIISAVVDNNSLIISRFRNRPKVEKYTRPSFLEPCHRFEFKSQIKRARITIKNLINGFSYEFPICVFDTTSSVVLGSAHLPNIKVESYKDTRSVYPKDLFTIEIPKLGWEEGIWVLNAEISFSNNGLFETLCIKGNNPFFGVKIHINDNTENPLFELIGKAIAAKDGEKISFTFGSPELLQKIVLLLNCIRKSNLSNVPEFKKWVPIVEKKCCAYIKWNFKANRDNNDLGALFQLSEESPSRLLNSMEIFGLNSIYYDSIPDTKCIQFLALKACNKIMGFTSVLDIFVSGLLHRDFTDCYKTISEDKEDFDDFNIAKYWDKLKTESPKCDYNIESFKDILSKKHWDWAFNKSISRRYNSANDPHANLLFVNSYTGKETSQLAQRLKRLSKGIFPESIWNNILPEIEGKETIDRNLVNFTAIYTLACRLSSIEDISFTDWENILDLTGIHKPGRNDETVIKAVFFTYKEVFSFFILFWETLIKTYRNV